MRHATRLLTTGVVVLAVTGCGSRTPPTRSGGDVAPVSLTGLSYTSNALSGETMAQLTKAVATRSGGAITLTPGPAVDSGAADGSSAVIEMVERGEVDVAVVAARSFDLVGVTSLQALNVPLLVDTPRQAAALLADPVTEQMLDGLSSTGLVGLALVYDQLRQPLGYLDPVVEPGDLRGATVLARPSDATTQVLAALGATADPRNGADASAAIQSGQVSAAETSMDRPTGSQSGADGQVSTVTGNVQLSIKANVVVVNGKVWSGLSDDQRDVFHGAAGDTRNWAAGQLVELASAAAAFCAQGVGDVVVADAGQLARWRSATASVTRSLEDADPATAAAVTRARQLVVGPVSTDVPVPCRAAGANALPAVTAQGDQSVVAGEWRLQVDRGGLLADGASAQEADDNAGVWTFVLRPDGSYGYTESHGRTCRGTYAVAGNRLSLRNAEGVIDCEDQWDLAFARAGDAMTWSPTAAFVAVWPPIRAFLAGPLTRIGDAPPA